MPTDKVKLKRQRARNTSFDLNRSSPQIKEKYVKNNQQERMPPPIDNSNIIDMSQTINTGKAAGAIPKSREKRDERMEEGEDLPRSLKDMVTESVEEMRRSLNHSIRDIVNENVGRQLSSVHQSIALLREAIRGLSLGNQVRQRANLPRENDDNLQRDRAARPNIGVSLAVDPPPVVPPGELIPPLAVNAPQLPYYGNRTRVERFGIKFNGIETYLSVESFVFRLEHCQRQYQIPWREILDDFHLLVSGQALDWYWLHVETTQVTSWESLRHALLSRFKTHRTNLDIMHELVERRQKPGENINDFFYHINLLRSKLEQPISEYEMIKLVKRNLRESIGRIIYPIPVSSIEQLRIECVEAERNFARREERHATMNVSRKSLHEIQYNSSPEKVIEIEEVGKDMRCWNCQESGHGFIDCPSERRTVFCYKCGKPEVITPKCPHCSSRGNNKRGVISTGESRPAKQTPEY